MDNATMTTANARLSAEVAKNAATAKYNANSGTSEAGQETV